MEVQGFVPREILKSEIAVSDGVHSMLEKSLKMLEFGIKTSRPLKVLEILEKSLNLNLANFEILHSFTILKQALVCM